MPKRPSHKELSGKLGEAKDALCKGPGLYANSGKAVGELNQLDIQDSSEIWGLILELLKEIQPSHYSGARPPLKSYEASIEGHDLFAFSWQSQKCQRAMYLKFALNGGRFYYVSLHEDRPEQKENT